ncbi:MAG: hypothetical protein HY223_01965 [Thaumarchaeota archaeon]|nr:hypothetical protein [Nitrososphaerota archaeon]
MILEKIKKELKSKEFWLSIAIGVPTIIGIYFKDYNPLSILLALPFTIMVLIMLPLMAAIALSIDIAVLFVRLHKKYHKIYAKIFKINNDASYTIRKEFEKDTSQKNFTLFNTWYSLGITLLILHQIGIDKLQRLDIIGLMVSLVLLSIIITSAFNISIYLMKKCAIMFENSDGTRVNLGTQLGNMINSFISPIQIISFSYVIVQSTAVNAFVAILILSLIICLSSSWFSFYLLKRKQISKLMEKFAQKLSKNNLVTFGT